MVIFCTGCSMVSSTNPYNAPFINSDETIQLQQGMKKQDVLSKIGDPLYVESGMNNTIIWIYEVRATEVLSDTDILTSKIIVNKTNANTRHSAPIHQLKLIFVDNKIKQWDMIIKGEKSKLTFDKELKIEPKITKEIEKPKKKQKKESKKSKTKNALTISPILSLFTTSNTHDNGSGIGISFLRNNIGFEYNQYSNKEKTEPSSWDTITKTDKTSNMLFYYKKTSEKFNKIYGIGIKSYTHKIHSKYDDTTSGLDFGGLYLNVGIGKDLKFKKIQYTPILSLNLNLISGSGDAPPTEKMIDPINLKFTTRFNFNL